MTTFLTMSRVMRSRPSSGSWTVRIASMTASWVRLGIGGRVPSQVEAPMRGSDGGSVDIVPRASRRPRWWHEPTMANTRIPRAGHTGDDESRTAACWAESSLAFLTPVPRDPYPRPHGTARGDGGPFPAQECERTCPPSTSASSMSSSATARPWSSTTSTSRSRPGNSSRCLARRAAARPRPCG